MKHILNNLSEQEKNAIREQHTGGMKVMTENFHRLLGSKLGDVKPLVSEQLKTKDGVTYTVQTIPSGKFKIFVTTPTYKTPTDASTVFGGGSMWKEYDTQGDAQKVIDSVVNSQVNKPKPGYSKPLVSEQAVTTAGVAAAVAGLGGLAMSIVNGSGTSDQKVKQFCDLCRKSKVQITQMSNQQADDIRDSVQGMGTDEDKIYQVIGGLKTFDEFCALVKSYQQSYSVELYNDLDDDIDNENEWVQIFRPIRNLLLRQQQQPTTGAKPTNPTFGAKTNPTFGAKPTNPTFGAKTNPTFGAKPTNPTFGAKPTAVPTKQPKFTSK